MGSDRIQDQEVSRAIPTSPWLSISWAADDKKAGEKKTNLWHSLNLEFSQTRFLCYPRFKDSPEVSYSLWWVEEIKTRRNFNYPGTFSSCHVDILIHFPCGNQSCDQINQRGKHRLCGINTVSESSLPLGNPGHTKETPRERDQQQHLGRQTSSCTHSASFLRESKKGLENIWLKGNMDLFFIFFLNIFNFLDQRKSI